MGILFRKNLREVGIIEELVNKKKKSFTPAITLEHNPHQRTHTALASLSLSP